MYNLTIAPTVATPAIVFDEMAGTLEFSGQSYPEDSVPFYRAIQDQLDDYLANTRRGLTLIFKLDYFNTSSSKCLLNLLEVVERHHAKNNNILVKWLYAPGDEDMHDSGIDFSLDVLLPFEFGELPA